MHVVARTVFRSEEGVNAKRTTCWHRFHFSTCVVLFLSCSDTRHVEVLDGNVKHLQYRTRSDNFCQSTLYKQI